MSTANRVFARLATRRNFPSLKGPMNSTCMALATAAAVALPGCSRPAPAAGPGSADAAGDSARLVDRVWRVAESNASSPGDLVVFLSEGTLVFASPHALPAFGKWSYRGDSLTMIEEGQSYRVEIVSLTDDGLRLKSFNPGEPVETRFVPAEE